MPHFVLDCSDDIFKTHPAEQIIQQAHNVANSTRLFDEGDINVRVNPFNKYSIGNKRDDFIHVFAHIIEGRTIEQKADLSKKVVQKLSSMFPHISKISMNIRDIEKATYCNIKML